MYTNMASLTLSRFDTVPACNGRTDRRTDGHTTTANTVLAYRRTVKINVAKTCKKFAKVQNRKTLAPCTSTKYSTRENGRSIC